MDKFPITGSLAGVAENSAADGGGGAHGSGSIELQGCALELKLFSSST